MRRIALRKPRAGHGTVARSLQREGWQVKFKRVHQLWKMEGLKVPAKARKGRQAAKVPGREHRDTDNHRMHTTRWGI